jgi:hypothetical protein
MEEILRNQMAIGMNSVYHSLLNSVSKLHQKKNFFRETSAREELAVCQAKLAAILLERESAIQKAEEACGNLADSWSDFYPEFIDNDNWKELQEEMSSRMEAYYRVVETALADEVKVRESEAVTRKDLQSSADESAWQTTAVEIYCVGYGCSPEVFKGQLCTPVNENATPQCANPAAAEEFLYGLVVAKFAPASESPAAAASAVPAGAATFPAEGESEEQ